MEWRSGLRELRCAVFHFRFGKLGVKIEAEATKLAVHLCQILQCPIKVRKRTRANGRKRRFAARFDVVEKGLDLT
jgi:hypothetical protein